MVKSFESLLLTFFITYHLLKLSFNGSLESFSEVARGYFICYRSSLSRKPLMFIDIFFPVGIKNCINRPSFCDVNVFNSRQTTDEVHSHFEEIRICVVRRR